MLETVTPKEMRDAFAAERRFWQERATGVKWHETAQNVPPSAPSPSVTVLGPAAGFAWTLRIVAVNLAAAGTFGAWKGESVNGRPIANPVTSTAIGGQNVAVIFFSDDIVIQAAQQVFLFATQNIANWYLGAVQVPAERLGEILT